MTKRCRVIEDIELSNSVKIKHLFLGQLDVYHHQYAEENRHSPYIVESHSRQRVDRWRLCLNSAAASSYGCIQRPNVSQRIDVAVSFRRLIQRRSRNVSSSCRVRKDAPDGSAVAPLIPRFIAEEVCASQLGKRSVSSWPKGKCRGQLVMQTGKYL